MILSLFQVLNLFCPLGLFPSNDVKGVNLIPYVVAQQLIQREIDKIHQLSRYAAQVDVWKVIDRYRFLRLNLHENSSSGGLKCLS